MNARIHLTYDEMRQFMADLHEFERLEAALEGIDTVPDDEYDPLMFDTATLQDEQAQVATRIARVVSDNWIGLYIDDRSQELRERRAVERRIAP